MSQAKKSAPRIAIIGCGDVSRRHYLPALERIADRVEVVACTDVRLEQAEALADEARAHWPNVCAYADIASLAAHADADAAINLTPAPQHAAVSEASLRAGLHVYSEKPLALLLADANRLVDLASDSSLLLLCAPGEAVSERVRWLREIVESGRFGDLTLIVASHADLGPAAWREYTGDPEVFYGPAVGPVFDHGIYRLHAMTALMGPVRRVQAMGAIGNSTRVIRGGPRTGESFTVTAPDYVLINLEFANGGHGQLLASHASASTRVPWLELHFTRATISWSGRPWEPDAAASIFLDDESPLGLEGWLENVFPPPDTVLPGVVEAGVAHFIACLRGEETPVLTAEHARHVLDVILKTYASIADGKAYESETTMEG